LKKKNKLLEVFVEKKLEEAMNVDDVQLPTTFLEYEFIDLAEKLISESKKLNK
jgi:hypothetical protein